VSDDWRSDRLQRGVARRDAALAAADIVRPGRAITIGHSVARIDGGKDGKFIRAFDAFEERNVSSYDTGAAYPPRSRGNDRDCESAAGGRSGMDTR